MVRRAWNVQALLANGLPVVTTFSGVLPPLGNISVAGADNGLTFGLAVEGTSAQLVFDGTLGRPVNTTETGKHPQNKGLFTFNVEGITSISSAVLQLNANLLSQADHHVLTFWYPSDIFVLL